MVIDEGGMDHTDIDEGGLSARYVLHGLSTDEEQRFEAHLLTCAACQDAVESELALRDGLRDLPRFSEAGVTASKASPGQIRLPAWVLAVAASALLVVSGALAIQLRRISAQRDTATAKAVDARRQRDDIERSAAGLAARLAQAERQREAGGRASSDRGAPAAVFALTMTRSAGLENSPPANRVRIGRAKWIVLTLDLATQADSSQFVATLSDTQSHSTVWSGGPFEPVAPDTLTLALDAALLHSGDFTLRVERRLAGGRVTPEGEYTFRVIR